MLAVATSSCSSGGADAIPQDGITNNSAPSEPAADVDAGSTAAPDATTAEGTDTTAASDDTTRAQNAPPEPSPLEAFLGFGQAETISAEQQAEWDQQSQQVEQLTAECMQAQGFTYIPFVADGQPVAGEADPYSLPADQFAAQYGYGMSTIENDVFGTRPDPNTSVVEAMGVDERGEYYKALYGEAITVDDEGNPAFDAMAKQALDEALTAGEELGCSAEANDAVYGASEPKVSEDPGDYEFTAIEDSMAALSNSIETDPRVAEATTTWIGCMAGAGYPGYTERTDAPIDVADKLSDLRGDALDLSGVDPEALQQLREYEISVAAADWDCGMPWDATHRTVQAELETEFIEQNRDELEAYRDGLADGTAGHG